MEVKSTFNLPNFNYKSIWQDPNELGKSIHGFLPNITGSNLVQANNTSGCFYGLQNANVITAAGTGINWGTAFDASRCSSVYQNGQTQVVPAAVCITFYIKY